MASALKTILNGIVTALPASWDKLDASSNAHLGTEQLALNGEPPRITWVPLPETIRPLDKKQSATQGCLYVRSVTCEAHLWGADIDAIDDPTTGMLPLLVQALHTGATVGGQRTTISAYQLSSGRWVIGEDAIVKGVLYVLPVAFQIPIVRATATTGSMDTIPVTTKIVNPATLVETTGPSFTLP